MREVRFYRTDAGRCPVEEYLDSLSAKPAQKVIWVLRLVEELEMVPVQYLKKLEGSEGIWEVRAQHGGDTFRLLGFFTGSGTLILTNGFTKKSAKTPRQEILLAEQRRREWQQGRQPR